MITIENQQLQATFSTLGAELISLKGKKTNIEYIWNGNPEFWNRHAPVLFPFVGRLKDNQYQFKGKTYQMGQHGFARDMEFTITQQSPTDITFTLVSDEKTKTNYPFDFQLNIRYSVGGDGLMVVYEVVNTGADEMYFSIGGHPAFNVPLEAGLNFEDYFLDFSPKKSRTKLPLAGPYIDLDQRTLAQTNTAISLSHALFKEDALVFETRGLNSYTIASEKSEHSVTLSYSDMNFVGIWSPYPKKAPFVCIEPWCGVADTLGTTGELSEKFGIKHLASQGKFTTKYAITVK
ncbi:aldose 1-epimerase family protein [Enterococcus sp. LJL90]